MRQDQRDRGDYPFDANEAGGRRVYDLPTGGESKRGDR